MEVFCDAGYLQHLFPDIHKQVFGLFSHSTTSHGITGQIAAGSMLR